MTRDILSVRIVDLLEAGLLRPPVTLYGYYEQQRIVATLRGDGTFVCGSTISSSPSVAAGLAITSKWGRRTPGRNYWSINGWQFWQVSSRDGETVTLADLRREYLAAR
jgi:hypothetical protein